MSSTTNRGRASGWPACGLAFVVSFSAVWSVAHYTTYKDDGNPRRFLSDVYRINRLYASMQGPVWRRSDLYPGENLTGRRYWITGVRLRVVGENRLQEESSEWFCHANLTMPGDNAPGALFGESAETPVAAHRRLNPDNPDLDHRLFTLAPGRSEIQLPAGFGIPMSSGEPLEFMSMALNLNERRPDKRIRFMTEIATSLDPGLKPVFRRALYCHVQDTPENRPRPDAMCVSPVAAGPGGYAASCGPDMRDFRPATVEERFGKNRIMHWIVPPGRHSYTNDVTGQLDLPRDTTVHYATGHVHPFGERLTLIEKRGGEAKQVVCVTAKSNRDRLGVEKVSEVSSVPGIPVAKSSRFELAVDYNNPTGRNVDAMAILYLYLSE